MGLSSKQVSGDQGLDWGGTLLQSEAGELSKPPPMRRQPPAQIQAAESLKCPRCSSTNTKFCYYNNYNKSQPRHFCKSCKRHWTKGGTLRNVPVGGGRKNKRPKISKAAAATTTTSASPRHQDLPDFPLGAPNATTSAQKSMSNILYHALIRSSSPLLHETTKGIMGSSNGVISSPGLNLSSSAPHNPATEFHFSSLSTFDMNASLNSMNYQPLNAFDHYTGNLDSMEESTITTVNIPSSSSGPWPGPDTSTTLDLPSYWNWNDIDVLNSADLNISWDDDDGNAEIKP